jgi:hypothetical protein
VLLMCCNSHGIISMLPGLRAEGRPMLGLLLLGLVEGWQLPGAVMSMDDGSLWPSPAGPAAAVPVSCRLATLLWPYVSCWEAQVRLELDA